jgi:hypothetical protein
MGKKSRNGSGIRIQDEQPGSYFLELTNYFLGLKYLNSLMRIRDPGWKKFRSGINIPDPQHCVIFCIDELASLGASSPKVHLVEMEVTDYAAYPAVVDKVKHIYKEQHLKVLSSEMDPAQIRRIP